MKKTWIITACAILGILILGIAIPKLTVHDTVPADADRSCVEQVLNKPIKKLSWEWIVRATGQTQVVSADAVHGDVKFYTLFRIPLDLNISINCLLTAEVTLTDGEQIDSVGTFRDSTVENGLKAYSSSEMGISFQYPTEYLLFENQSTFNGVDYHSFTIAPKEPMLQAIARARANFAGEGPPTMGISFMSNPKSLSLQQWMRDDTAHSNFNPDADPGAVKSLASTTVAGIPALKWHSEMGLYVMDYVAFLYGKWVVVVSAADMGANTNKDFQTVLDSIQTSQAQTYTNKALGFSIDKPTGVYFMGEKDGVVAFSLLPTYDPRQASSIGLVNVLTITSARTAPAGGKDVKINGENASVSSTIGAYGGETHWSYFFPDHDLLIEYVENKPLYEKMISTIRFE